MFTYRRVSKPNILLVVENPLSMPTITPKRIDVKFGFVCTATSPAELFPAPGE
jgi:hypothetical protein